MSSVRILSLAAIAALGLAARALADEKVAPLAKEKEIALEGEGYFDYVNFDAGANRLYVAHGACIDVIDLKEGKRIGQVEGVDGSHGAVIAGKHGFATAGRKAKMIVFDPATLKVEKEIETGPGCDGILSVGSANEVWSFNGGGRSGGKPSITCVDPEKLEVKGTIALEGKPEAAVEDAAKGFVYVNLEDRSEIAVIDLKAHKVTGTHALEGAEEPSGLAFDAKNGLLFAGCGNQKMAIVSTADWKQAATLDIGEHCDGCAFDPATGNAFASCRTGTFVVHEKDAKTFESLPSLEGGKTCSLDPKTHRLFVTSGPRRGEKGTVKVTVFAPAQS